MRTARALTVSPSMLCSWGVSALRGVGGLVSAPGGGVSAPGGGIPACTEADPPPVNRITDACENITLPQLRCGGNEWKKLDPPTRIWKLSAAFASLSQERFMTKPDFSSKIFICRSSSNFWCHVILSLRSATGNLSFYD